MSLSLLVAMEIKIFFSIIYNSYDINFLTDMAREHGLKSNLPQLYHSMLCKNIAGLTVAKEYYSVVARRDAL